MNLNLKRLYTICFLIVVGIPSIFSSPYSPDFRATLQIPFIKSFYNSRYFGFPPPTNDDCNMPQVLTDGITETGSTLLATSQMGETNPNGTSPFASVWYSIVITGNHSLTINVTPSGGTPIINPIIGVYQNQCNTSPNLFGSCLTSGTYYIQISSLTTTNDGDFDLNVSIDPEVMATAATLELCENADDSAVADFVLSDADATVLNGQSLSVTYHSTQSDADAGSGALSTPYNSGSTIIYARVDNGNGCYATSQVTLTVHPWPTVTDITASSTNVCEGSSFDLTVTNQSTNPSYTYDWSIGSLTGNPLTISSASAIHSDTWIVTVTDGNGCTASSSIDITVTANPSNDACADAATISAPSGSGDNNCATQDETNCGTSSEASVWYVYTVPANMHTITFSLSGLTNGVIRVLDGCAGNDVGDSGCGTSVTVDCPEDGSTLMVYVSSPSADAGPFTVDITETMTTASNDLCTNATAITEMDLCQWIPKSGTSSGSCPEDFTVGGCGLDYSAEGIVWYTFTPPTGTTNTEFQSITGTLTVFEDCPGATIATGGSCLTSNGTVDATAGNTYYIAIGNSDGSGNVGFDIKFNAAPANDLCTDAAPISAPSGSGDNNCATQDETNCGTGSEASVWYVYTVPANMHTITFSLNGLTNGVIRVLDGCAGNDVGDSGCGTSVTVDCPEDGSTLMVYVSSPSADAGPFTVDITETMTTASNDLCTNATAITEMDLCQWIPKSGTSSGSCPEDFTVGGCGLDYSAEGIVWYTFTPPTGTTNTEFQSIMGTLTVFEDCPGTTIATGGSCLTSTGSVDATAGNTYYIAIGNSDGSGNVGFDIKFNAAPANDLCGDAESLGSGGSASGTNSCAGADVSFNCATDSYESSVWYSINIPSDMGGVEITITGTGGTPLMSGGAVTLFESDCTTAVGESCFSVGALSQILCIVPGDYLIQVSTSSANAGEFNIDVNPIRGADNAPGNDFCDDAEQINMTVICEPISVSGNNADACHEIFSIGSCDFGNDPTTWHSFTLDANAETIDITDITGGAYLGIFEESPCGTNSPAQLPGGGCITSDTQDIPVTGGSTYYIAVGNSTGGPYTFNITQTVLPPNNTPCTAEEIGTATQNTTCCATNNIASDCGATASESSVWFVIPAAAGVIGYEISFSNGSMSGEYVVEVYQGADCNSLAAFGEDFRAACNTGTINTTVMCADFDTQNTYIRVGSSSSGCGTFSLSANPITQTCNAATDCSSLTPVPVPTGGQACISGCNLSLCGDGACDPDGNATYYAFEIDPTTATSAIITINNASFTPIISVAYDCFGPFLSCFNGSISDPVSPGPGIIYVRVEASGGNSLDDDFDVCVNAFDGGAFDCYSASFMPSRPEYPNENPNGPYCSGEVVHFCYNVDFTVSPGGTAPPNGNNCQWIQGIVPVIYDGWDLVAMPVSTQGPGGWSWLDEGIVHYNFNSPQYAPITLPDGSLGLEWGQGGLGQGGDMPAGWYYSSPGSGPDCTDGTNPDTAWGLPAGCGSSQNVNFCFDLKVKDFATIDECEAASLKITMFSFADGETGCWVNLSCALSTPYVWNGQAACNSLVTIEGDDIEICSNGIANIIGTASDPGSIITLTTTDNPNVTGETLSGSFPFGTMNIFDQLVNNSTVPQVVEYVLTASVPGQVCTSPPKTILVTVYPELDVTINPAMPYICNIGDCINLTATALGGTSNFTDFQWSGPSFSGNGAMVQVCPTGNSQYIVTVTDALGCTGTESVDVELKDPVTVEIDPLELNICKDGVPGNSDYLFATLTSNQFPYSLTWTNPSGLIGFGSPFYTATNDRFEIFEEQSNTISNYVTVTATDEFGCTGTAQAYISIDAGPEPTFNYQYTCGASTVNLIADYQIGSSSTGLDKFELYACESGTEIYIGEMYDDPSTFANIDLGTYGTCFLLKTYSGGGCIVERTLTVATSTGVPVQLSGPTSICVNSSATVAVSNASNYTMFHWNTGQNTSSITVSPTQNTTYAVTATDTNGCANTASISISIDPLPIASFSGSTSICQGQSTSLTGSSNIPNSTFVWTNLSNGNTNTVNPFVVSAAGSYTLVAISPKNCVSIPDTLNIAADSNLQPNINALSICDGSQGTLDGGSGYNTYNWNTGESTQTISVNNGGWYYLTVTQGLCSGIDSVNVVNNSSPVVMLPTTPISVCRSNTGFGDTFVNFNNQISPIGSSGTWREISSSGVDLTDLTNVSFIGVPVGNYIFEFTTSTALPPCQNDIDTLHIAVSACQCPQILPTGPLCNQGSAPVNMNTKKGNTGLGGTFSVINPAGITMTNNVFDPTGLMAGTYTVEWYLTDNCRPTIEIKVNDKPKINLLQNTSTICNSNATGTTTLDLNTLLGAGTSPGSWTLVSGTASAFKSPSTVDGAGLLVTDVLVLKFETNGAVAPCTNVSETVTIKIRDCNCPQVTITPLTLCNGNNQQIDLNASNVLTVIPANIKGKWTSTAVGAISNNRYFNALNVPAGPYTITFTLDTPIAGCDPSYTQNITIVRQPKAEVKGPGTACNANTGNGSVTVTLSDLLKSGFTTGGTWSQSQGTPVLPIIGGKVDFTGQVIGSQFKFTYSLPAADPCTDLIVEVTVDVVDCNCPPILLNNPSPLCNESGVLDLTTLEQTGNSAGIWSIKNSQGNNESIANNIFDVKGKTPGVYTLTYTLTPAPGGSCTKEKSVMLTVEQQNTATLRDTIVCNQISTIGASTLDLRGLIVTQIGSGKWLDENKVEIASILNKSFVGVTPQILTYYFTMTSVSPCVNREIPVQIEVLDCSCPQITLGTIPSICTNNVSFDLSPYNDPDDAGSWISSSAQLLINNNIINLVGVPAGVYEIIYRLSNPPADPCPKEKKVMITIFNPKSAGTARGAEFCVGSTDVLKLADRLENESLGGTWSAVNGPIPGFNATLGQVDLTNVPAGTYTFRYSFTNQNPCPDDAEDLIIKINSLPVADAGADKILNCSVKSVELGTLNSSTGTNIVYEWTLNGQVVGATQKLVVTKEGHYSLTVRDTSTNCGQSSDVVVTKDADLPQFNVEVDTMACFGDRGKIVISDISGGIAPYQYSFDGGKNFSSSPIMTGLGSGQYQIIVRDANGCDNDQFPIIVLTEPPLLTVDLGPDFQMFLNTDTIVSIEGQITLSEIGSIAWKINGVDQPDLNNQLSFSIKMNENKQISVTVSDISGCVATDDLNINLVRLKPECLPNIFTPDIQGNGNNTFSINCDEVVQINNFRIYDRWGNMVYYQENLTPQDRNKFWDGKFAGKPAEAGVYVYRVDLTYADGSSELKAGDVTLIR